MRIIRTKHLAMRLSQLVELDEFSPILEQYQTEGQLAARWLSTINSESPLDGMKVVDIGAGNGILGLGAALLGASKVTLIEVDKQAVEIAKENSDAIAIETGCKIEVVEQKVVRWPDNLDADIIIMNPPWGFQSKGSDRILIEAALKSPAKIIHILHSADVKHPQAMAEELGWDVELKFVADFRLPMNMSHHTRNNHVTSAGFWCLKRS